MISASWCLSIGLFMINKNTSIPPMDNNSAEGNPTDGQLFYLMIAIWKFHDIIYSFLIICQIKNVEVFVYAARFVCQYLNECVRFELTLGDKLFNFSALYRYPSQLQDLFESFKKNLELDLESAVQNNPFLVFIAPWQL